MIILGPALIGIWLGGWYGGVSHIELMLASIAFMLFALLTDPRMVISVKPPATERPRQDYYVIEQVSFDLKLEKRPESQHRLSGLYRVVRDNKQVVERVGFCDYAPACVLVEQFEKQTEDPGAWDLTEYETTMYVIHAASMVDAMKEHPFGNTILHRTPRGKLEQHREVVRRVLEQQAEPAE